MRASAAATSCSMKARTRSRTASTSGGSVKSMAICRSSAVALDVAAPAPTSRATAEERQMAIDFTLPPDVLAVRERVRAFMEHEVAAAEARMRQEGGWRKGYAALREKA